MVRPTVDVRHEITLALFAVIVLSFAWVANRWLAYRERTALAELKSRGLSTFVGVGT